MTESEREARLNQVIAEYLRRIDAGEQVDREGVLKEHSEMSDELREFFSNHDGVEGTFEPLHECGPIGPLPQQFGRYTLDQVIGRGGMGVVYKAFDSTLKKPVALKMILAGRLASKEDVERFRREIRVVAELDHPNIISIYHVGEEGGQVYFTMKLMEGGSLENRLDSLRKDPGAVVRLVLPLAKAVWHAAQRPIVHRDLKPANVLLDSQGNPVLTDFGLARRIDRKDTVTRPDEIIGTLSYMAPEQLEPHRKPLTTAVDVYGLGAVLYALLTGRPPFEGDSSEELRDKVKNADPEPPNSLNPTVDADLSAVCLMCLEKSPTRRYESAQALAEDLQRWLDDRPVKARRIGRVERFYRWSKRHVTLVALTVLAVVAGVFLFLWADGVRLREAKRMARRDEILESNVSTARFVSNVILLRMREWGTRVEALSREPELVELLSAWHESLKARPSQGAEDTLQREEAKRLQGYLEKLAKDPLVVNWQIMDVHGAMVARTPAPVVGVDFRGRDYFKGTLKHLGRKGLEAVHVSSVYRSQADELDKFNICAPVEGKGGAIGVVAVSIATDPTLGIPHMQDKWRNVVLVAPWDPSPPNKLMPPGGPRDFVVLLHPAMTPRRNAIPFDARMFPVNFPRKCDEELSPIIHQPSSALQRSDYIDAATPSDGTPARTWLAGFAPVGNTGFVVIIQQRED